MTNDYTDFTIIPSKGFSLIIKAKKGDNWVILKGLKDAFRANQRLQNLLRKEYNIGKELDHPNIVKYYDYIDTEEYGKCIVEEYIEGRTLKDFLQENHSEEEKLAIIEQIGNALDYIHPKRINHNNLAPEHILLSKIGNQVKLHDFRAEYCDDLREPISTLKFLSPELKDGTVSPDGRSDIYSLGIILREMNLPINYDSIIKKCTGYGRNDRFDTAEELMDALENGERSEGSHRSLIIGIIVAIAAAVIAFIVFQSTGNADETPANNTPTEVTDSTSAPATETTAAPQPGQDTTAEQPVENVNSSDAQAFVEQIKPALYKDLDNIFQPYYDGTKTSGLTGDIRKYYKGLMKAQKGITPEQRAALDKLFGDYVAQKKSQLGK